VVKKQVDPDVEFDDSGSGHKSRLLRPQWKKVFDTSPDAKTPTQLKSSKATTSLRSRRQQKISDKKKPFPTKNIAFDRCPHNNESIRSSIASNCLTKSCFMGW
jgi:hypothetical protein